MKKHLRLLFVSILLTAILCGVIAVHYIRNWAPAPAELESKTIQMPPAAVEPAPHVKSAPVIKADTEKLPVPAEQEQEIQVTSPAFQDQLDILETKLPDTDSFTLSGVRESAPELAKMIDRDYVTISRFCLSDLLALDNIGPLRARLKEQSDMETSTEQQKIECVLFRLIVEKFEFPSCYFISNTADSYQWLADYYRFEVYPQCRANNANPDAPFYSEHPIQQQFLIVMLQEPVWRMPALTPLDGTCYDQDSYISATNDFWTFLQFGQQSPQLTIEPAVDNPRTLCTETAVWTMRQADDFTVTLEVDLENGDFVTLTYTPQHGQSEFVEK